MARLLAHISRLPLGSEFIVTFCLPNNLAWQYPSHWRRLGLRCSCSVYPITMPVKPSGEWVTPSSPTKRKKEKIYKPSSLTVSSLGTSRISTTGNPKAPITAESTPFAVLEEKTPHPPTIHWRERNYQSEGRTPDAPSIPRRRVRYHPCLNKVTPSLPDPVEKEAEVTPGDADVPDNIARALLDAL